MTATDRQRRIERHRERLASEPDAKVFAPLADLLRLEGRLDEALALLAQGLERHPTYLTARVIQGRTLLDAGRSGQARSVLRSVLDDDPENLVVLRLLAEDALGRGEAAEARPWLETLVVLDPEPAIWREALDRSRPAPAPAARPGDGGSGGGERAPDAADTGFATMTLVDIYLAQGYRDKAKAALDRILARDPEREDALARLADLARDQAAADARPPAGEDDAGDENLAERRRRKTLRRSEDKQKFAEWIDRLRDEGSPAP
jgi:tetratricopeptide (TPR) repeat protein